MEHYVTLFDRLFLPQGLALHLSMERHAGPYTLWIICMDDETYDALLRMALPHVRPLQLSRLETDELLRVKPGRSAVEYCWTVTPFAPRFVFEAEGTVQRVTYVDADLWFRKNPGPMFKELDDSGKQVLITDHAYAPEHDFSATNGQYCVQFTTFTRAGNDTVRKWWEERCVEWCFARVEDGKFGDQKYLDAWPELFPSEVHVLTNKELALAPWNATRFPYGNAVFWHFHALRILDDSTVPPKTDLGPFALPVTTRKYVYVPYLADLGEAVAHMKKFGIAFRPQKSYSVFEKIQRWSRFMLDKVRGAFPAW